MIKKLKVMLDHLTAIIPEAQVYLGKGGLFTVSHYIPILGDSVNLDLLIITGDAETNVIFNINSGVTCEGRLFEGTITSLDGNLLEEMNHNRILDTDALTMVYDTPTISDQGIQMNGTTLVGGNAGSSPSQPTLGGTTQSFNNKIILKPNSKYLFRTTNVSGGPGRVQSMVTWYESDL